MLAAVGSTAVGITFWRQALGRLLREFAAVPPEPLAAPGPTSVIVVARDEAPRLPRLLDDLLAQAMPDLEVVVADDDSADGTAEVVERRAREDRRLRYLPTGPKRHPGKKAALAAAIAHARHDWLLTTDADCRPATPLWAAAMRTAAGPHHEFVLGYSPYRRSPTPTWLNRWIRFEAFYTAVLYLGAALAGRPYMGVGRNLLYARRVYERVGGFAGHAHLAGGDDDLLVAAGAGGGNVGVCLDRRAWTYSEAHASWPTYARQKRRHLSVSHAYRPLDRLWLGLLAAAHVGHYAALLGLLAQGRARAALALYGVRMAAIWPRTARLQRQMDVGDLAGLFPLADAALVGYYLLGAASIALPRGRSDHW